MVEYSDFWYDNCFLNSSFLLYDVYFGSKFRKVKFTNAVFIVVL